MSQALELIRDCLSYAACGARDCIKSPVMLLQFIFTEWIWVSRRVREAAGETASTFGTSIPVLRAGLPLQQRK
ncbi:MAG: hypothetical protein Hals2KO_07960 [Halioglobus sp.]